MPPNAPTDILVSNTSPRPKAYRVFDGSGLYLDVFPNASKYWRWQFCFAGKEKRLYRSMDVLVQDPDRFRQLLRLALQLPEHLRPLQTLAGLLCDPISDLRVKAAALHPVHRRPQMGRGLPLDTLRLKAPVIDARFEPQRLQVLVGQVLPATADLGWHWN